MNQPILFQTILSRLGRYKLKSLFMGLGITVSVLATALLQTVAGGVRESFTAFIEKAYPSDSVVLLAGSGFMGGGRGRNNLKLTDVEAVAASLGTQEWDPIIYAGSRDLQHRGNSLRVGVVGCSEKAENVRNRSVDEGEFFTPLEVSSRSHVALIGTTTAGTLFPGESPIGQQIFIDNLPFEVKGVLESIGVDPHGNDQDNTIYVPYTTLMDKMLKRNYISGATFLVDDPDRAEAVRTEMIEILREQHQLGEGQEDDFSVITPALMNELLDRSFKTFNVFVPLIAGTAFLISAAVILSIMQINIRGRIPEIGLRKAIGARPRDLQIQILLEVLIIAAGAALLGVVLAQLASAALTPVLAAKFGVRELHPPVLVLAAAVGAAIVTGLLGGALPARRAAKLDPVKALR